MIDDDPCKSISSTIRDIRVSKFLIRQVVQEDIRYSVRKGQFLSKVMKYKMKDRTAKFLNKVKHPLQWFGFYRGEKLRRDR